MTHSYRLQNHTRWGISRGCGFPVNRLLDLIFSRVFVHKHSVSDATALPAVPVPRRLRGAHGDRGAAAGGVGCTQPRRAPPLWRPRYCPSSRLGSQVEAAGVLEVGVGMPRGAHGLGAGLCAPAGPGSTWAAPLEEPTPVPTRQMAPHLGPRGRRSWPGLGAASRDHSPPPVPMPAARARQPHSPWAASRSTGTRAPQASTRFGACPSSHRSPRLPGGPRRGLCGAPTWPEASRPRGWCCHASTPGRQHDGPCDHTRAPVPATNPRSRHANGEQGHTRELPKPGGSGRANKEAPGVPVCHGPGAASRQHPRPRGARDPRGREHAGPSWESFPSLGTARVSTGNMNVTDRSRSLKRDLVFDFRHCA